MLLTRVRIVVLLITDSPAISRLLSPLRHQPQHLHLLLRHRLRRGQGLGVGVGGGAGVGKGSGGPKVRGIGVAVGPSTPAVVKRSTKGRRPQR